MTKSAGDLSVDELYQLIQKAATAAVDAAPKTFFIEEVEKIVDRKFEEQQKNFWVPAEQHYLDHKMQEECIANRPEWMANHEFISSMRNQGQKAWDIGFKLAAVGFFGVLFASFNEGFRSFVVNLFTGVSPR